MKQNRIKPIFIKKNKFIIFSVYFLFLREYILGTLRVETMVLESPNKSCSDPPDFSLRTLHSGHRSLFPVSLPTIFSNLSWFLPLSTCDMSKYLVLYSKASYSIIKQKQQRSVRFYENSKLGFLLYLFFLVSLHHLF